MEEKKVSIILPVYNGADHIEESINSVLAQTYQNWELIIVNDCSTDDTLQICKNISQKDTRIIIISNNINLKLPKSLNVGFENASGDYYTWTSDDNLYKKNALEVMVDFLNSHKDVAMVYADYTNIDSVGNNISDVKLPESKNIVIGNVCGACFLYTSDVAKKVGDYDINLFLAEDYDYWIRISRNGKIIHLDKNLYYYRRHALSLTETKKSLIKEQTYKALEKNFLYLYDAAISSGLKYEFLEHVLRRGEGHIEETQKYLVDVDYLLKVRLVYKCIANKDLKNKLYIFLSKFVRKK